MEVEAWSYRHVEVEACDLAMVRLEVCGPVLLQHLRAGFGWVCSRGLGLGGCGQEPPRQWHHGAIGVSWCSGLAWLSVRHGVCLLLDTVCVFS